MKTRTLVRAALVFALGVMVFAAGMVGLAYERAVQSAREKYRAGDSYDAIKILERLTDLPFSDPRTNYNLGMALIDMSSHDEAMVAFRKFIASTDDPQWQAEGYYLLAWSLVLKVASERNSSTGRYSSSEASSLYSQALAYLAEAMRLDQSQKGAKNLYERLSHSNPLPGASKSELRPDPGQMPGQWEEPKP